MPFRVYEIYWSLQEPLMLHRSLLKILFLFRLNLQTRQVIINWCQIALGLSRGHLLIYINLVNVFYILIGCHLIKIFSKSNRFRCPLMVQLLVDNIIFYFNDTITLLWYPIKHEKGTLKRTGMTTINVLNFY